jgi:hypothetical protein
MLRRTPLPPPPGAFPARKGVSPIEEQGGEVEADEVDDDLGLFGLLPEPLPRVGIPTQPGPYTPSPPARAGRAPRPPRDPRSPWLALPGLLLLLSAAGFFGWVSAEPFWLSVGHGQLGRVTVAAGTTGCQGSFTGPGYTLSTVDIDGLSTVECRPGTARPARVVSRQASHAYATSDRGLVLRWVIGFGLVGLSGLLIGWVIGAWRLEGWRRLVAAGLSLAAPLALLAALLAVTY